MPRTFTNERTRFSKPPTSIRRRHSTNKWNIALATQLLIVLLFERLKYTPIRSNDSGVNLKKIFVCAALCPEYPCISAFLYRKNILSHLATLEKQITAFITDMKCVYPGYSKYTKRVQRSGKCRCITCQSLQSQRRNRPT